MKQTFLLYCRLIAVCFKAQMQHRLSFFMLMGAYFLSTFVDILGIWILFDRFKVIQGWTLEELSLIYGIMHIGFAIAEGTARGFDSFGVMVKHGDFDRILLRPRSTLGQIAVREIQLLRFGRLFQGLIVLLWGSNKLGLTLASYETLIIIISIIGTTCLFYGLFIIQAAISFWSVETLEIMNVTTYGGLEAGQYPLSIYNKVFRGFFTFIIPLGCVAYYPIATLLHHQSLPLWLGGIAPLAGVVFLLLSCQFWKLGVRHYHSTGS